MSVLDLFRAGYNYVTKQRPTTFDSPDKVDLRDLKPGIFNTLKENGVNQRWDDAEKIRSSIDLLRSEINDAKRYEGYAELRGVVVVNETPDNNKSAIKGVTAATCADIGYRMGEPRGMCRVYIPELHSVLMPLTTTDFASLGRFSKLFYFCTEVWGDREYMKALKPGAIVDVSLPELNNYAYATIIVPNSGSKPQYSVKGSEAADVGNPYGQFNDPSKPDFMPVAPDEVPKKHQQRLGLKNAFDNNFPSDRPNADVAKKLHTSVDKNLLKKFMAYVGPQKKSSIKQIDRTGLWGHNLSMGGTPIKYPKGSKKTEAFWCMAPDTVSGALVKDKSDGTILTSVYAAGAVQEDGKSLEGNPVLRKFPDDLRSPNAGTTGWIHLAAIEPLRAMIAHARSEGFGPPLLTVWSAYRTIGRQRTLFKNQVAQDKRAIAEWNKANADAINDGKKEKKTYNIKASRARTGDPDAPGFTGGGHLSGLAFDLEIGYRIRQYRLDMIAEYAKRGKPRPSRETLDKRYRQLMKKENDMFKWLQTNASFYGFYNYPKEPWHWEYNPADWEEKQSEPLEREPTS